ncbi:hypothetical protein CRM22_004857 [Opisthorchis felineus]|uniref:Uncharacterized protein n=1 Tax=Opisthorchis felineus TaxID=147828 RepID=A0A4S2M0G5_OPIFE|nr:hypothetical protein CRM22_004857 [Opisthorchis felineus]
MSDGEKVNNTTVGGGAGEAESFRELTNLVNEVLRQFQDGIIKMIDKVNNKNILFGKSDSFESFSVRKKPIA